MIRHYRLFRFRIPKTKQSFTHYFRRTPWTGSSSTDDLHLHRGKATPNINGSTYSCPERNSKVQLHRSNGPTPQTLQTPWTRTTKHFRVQGIFEGICQKTLDMRWASLNTAMKRDVVLQYNCGEFRRYKRYIIVI
jgi:hypothetical protein